MAKLPRVTAKVFASNADAADIGQYGSALAGTKVLTSDISTIQALPAYETGWRGAVVSTHNYPTLQEMNGLQKTFSQQIAYTLQSGIPEWDANTEYYEYSFCRVDDKIFYSIIDNNIGSHPVDDGLGWELFISGSSGNDFIIDTYVNGSTWYRLYNSGWKEQGGLVSTSATELPWGQPTLNNNGTMGGNSFACETNTKRGGSQYQAYGAFNPSSSVAWVGSAATAEALPAHPQWLTFYNPTPLKVTQLTITNISDWWCVDYTITASNDNSTWTTLTSGTNTNYTSGGTWTISLSSNSNFYKYYRFTCTRATGRTGSASVGIRYMAITATYQQSAANEVVFPLSFANTNYAFSLGFYGASGGNAYVSTKTKTGMSLSNTSAATVSWMAVGY